MTGVLTDAVIGAAEEGAVFCGAGRFKVFEVDGVAGTADSGEAWTVSVFSRATGRAAITGKTGKRWRGDLEVFFMVRLLG